MSPSYAKRAAMTHRVAIVGAGPSGFYAADGLLRAQSGPSYRHHRPPADAATAWCGPAWRPITRAPRRGRASSTGCWPSPTCASPAISRSAATSPGTSSSPAYDAVIVATGMVIDRKLGVPGEDLPHVWGSWRFVGWLNGHPDFRQGPDLSKVRSVAVIGNGNVALDVARVLAKSADEMAKSDIVPEAGAAIAAAPLTDIHVIGRRGPEHASFTNNELAEMGRLARAVAVTDAKGAGRRRRRRPIRRPSGCARPRTWRSCGLCQATSRAASRSRCISVFNAAPVAFRPGEVELTTGKLAADLVVTCIGYSGEDFPRREDVFPGRLGQARARPARSRPTAPRAMPWPKQVMAWLKDARSQERARRAADRRRRRGLAPHRQARGRGRRRPGPASREIDGLAGAVGRRAGRLTALLLLLVRGDRREFHACNRVVVSSVRLPLRWPSPRPPMRKPRSR